MKYAWMNGHSKTYALTEMCVVFNVSISGYRAWKRGGTVDRKRLTDAQTLAVIRAIHAEIKGAYGSPRMLRELRLRGFTAGKERVERLMRENGIRARHKRRYKATTDSKHDLPVAANLLAEILRRPRRTKSGRRTLRICGLKKAGCIWRSCWICSIERSLAGRSSRA